MRGGKTVHFGYRWLMALGLILGIHQPGMTGETNPVTTWTVRPDGFGTTK
ncbi:MAG: hypothetical protein HQL96_17570 [Magnetococcales bacterium]|nr:hypothetical protein [Magnetococcales bacterium]